MTLSPTSRIGPYEVLASLGAGGMGEVWRARDTRVGRDVAVKVLPEAFFDDAERKSRFEREARTLASLNHPNVATLFSFEEIPAGSAPRSRHILVMELLEGETLRERLLAGPLSVRKAIDIAVQMTKGLAAAHEKKIAHRDLKPENVFLTKDGRVKILDFGLAKLSRREEAVEQAGEAETLSRVTEGGTVLGTVGYMSPEQVRGEPVDHRSDIFSFGTILYETLSGKNPFRRPTPPETMTAILKEEPPLLSDTEKPCSPALSRIVARCLEKRPEARFQGAADLAFGLETLTSTSTSPHAESAPGLTRRPRILGWRSASAAAGLLLALGGAYLLGNRPSASPPSFLRLTFRRGYVDGARFAPDGQTILYGATWEGGPVHVYSARIGNPETGQVSPLSAMLLGVSRAGDLALLLNPTYPGWRWDGTLAQAPFAGGSPKEILRNVSEADWALDGSTLAVARLANESFRLELPPGTLLYESKGRIGQPRFSRDGTRIAFLDHPALHESDGDVSVVDRSGRKTVLSKGWRNLMGLAWSPRGDEIWFTGSRTGRAQSLHAVSLSGRERAVARWGGNWTLHDVSPDGRALLTQGAWRLIGTVSTPAGERDLSWFDWSTVVDLTPDGKVALLAEWGEGVGGKFVAYLRNTDGSPAVRLGEGAPIALSPDGRWVVVSRNLRTHSLVLLPTGAGPEVRLPSGPLAEGGAVAFFPDGKRILLEGAAKDGRQGLWVQDLDGSVPRPFGPDGLSHPRVSPDGRRIAALADSSALRILTEEGKVQQSVAFPAETSLIGWAQDGTSLYVGRATKGLSAWVDRLNLASGRLEPWREVPPYDPAGALGPPLPPAFVTPDGKNIASTYLRNLSDLYLVEGLK